MKTLLLTIEGMHCRSCATTVQALLERQDGVRKASALYKDGAARVLYDPDRVSEEQLIGAIERSAYRVTGRSDG